MTATLWACVVGCASNKETRKAPSSSGVEKPYEEGEADSQTGVAALSGTWSGSADVKGHGMATAVVILNQHGEGSWSGSLAGLPHSGLLRVSYWDGQWLEGQAMGYQQRVRGTLEGNKLRLVLPYVGTVTIFRASK